jgi:hypothetical protein
MAGYCIGKFTGLSLATNAEVEWKDFYLSTQTQYSLATKKDIANFFFSWSEAGYKPIPELFRRPGHAIYMAAGSKRYATGTGGRDLILKIFQFLFTCSALFKQAVTWFWDLYMNII